MPPSRPEDGARYGGMAGADERGSRGLDLPPGMSLRDIEVDPDLDSVHDAELGLEELEAKLRDRLARIPSPMDAVVIIDNVPIVDNAKRDKLLSVIRRIFKNIGNIVEPDGMYMPMEDGSSKGYLFVEFETPEEATNAVKQGDGYRLDKAHVLSVMHFKDVEKFANMSEEYKEPAEEPFVAKEHLKSWLLDPRGRDQFAVMRGEETAIFWNSKPEEELIYTRANWTESYVQYSTYGTYLATFHRQGIALWGGPQWERLARFAHPGVKLIDFSPKENYLVSFSPEPITTPEGDQHNLLVWDITSGRLMRSFLVEPPGSQPRRDDRPPPQFEWPVFKWTPDDVFLARMNPDSISVYQTPDMGMLDKKSIKVEEIQGMVMSPNGNVLAYWTPEIGNNPARVTLIRLPSKEIVRTKNLFSVKECKLYFSPSGSHLAVHVTRYTKTKKSTFSNIEIFRLRERDVPIDVLEVKQTEEVQLFCWEPEGNRFAFLGIEGAGAAARNTVYFYEAPSGATVAAPVPGTKDASATPATVKLLKAMERKNVMGLHWSPKGRFIVIRNAAGELEFFDTEEMSTMSMTEHFGANHVDWDPSGRYVASTASGWKGGSDTGYNIYTLVGTNIVRRPLPGFRQFVWRPRPPLMLSAEKRKEIRKNLKEYSKEFDEIDAAATTAVGREVRERRVKLMDEWRQYRRQVREKWEEERSAREHIPGWRPQLDAKLAGQQADEEEEVEEIEEVVIAETEEVVDRIPGEDDDDDIEGDRSATPGY